MPYIKQIVAVRRSPGLTRQEFFDYHFQVHGRISTGPSPAENPSKYFQIHIEDAAYHQQDPSRGPNANPAWAFSDDITELYFESADHIDRVFKSPWVKEKVGPDGAKFSDFGASLPVTVQETLVPLQEGVLSEDFDSPVSSPVAMYFITTKNGGVDGLVSGFATDLPFDASAHFGSVPGRPVFDLVFSIHLGGKEGVQDLRKAQSHFEEAYASQINLENTWIAFGQRALVFDQDKDIKFDPARHLRL
ncbi:uncharacterized protein BKA55DRAFT_739534 [Fusarium redolens]|uniref:EthD domain-containing protein n=1 Tax=Fusarium redolens TaxID=48865 RepID=A0A9P9GZA3_FUSRE|nr:uncharacterized protein BKA55DRAFT_739534 [Fusarium redolens]KAH7247577.1 hypothetical protein BKA55DRAFT_739534 [Fusarium redolens]